MILEITAMVNDNLSRDTEPWDNLIEKEQYYYFTIIFISGHVLSSLFEVVYGHDNVPVICFWRQITSCKINTPLSKRTDSDNGEKRSWMCMHLSSINLTGVTVFEHFVEILNNKHIFNGYYPDHVLLRNTYTIHKLLYVDHQYSSINNNKTSRALTH